MIAITGASGNLGKATLSFLLQKTDARNLVAIVRDPQKLDAGLYAGVNIRIADYEDPLSLENALKGVDTLLHISASGMGEEALRQETNVVNAAIAAGVGRAVYTSTLCPVEGAHFLAAAVCRNTEALLRNSGMDYVIFRNSMYLETIPLFIGSAMEDGQIYYPSGNGKVSFASRLDIAEALANVLASPHSENAVYDITGAGAWNFADIAAVLRELVYPNAAHTDIPAENYGNALQNFGMGPDEISFYASMADAIRAGEFKGVNPALENLLGRKPMDMADYLKSLF